MSVAEIVAQVDVVVDEPGRCEAVAGGSVDEDHVLGTNPRFAPIDGPGDLAALGAPFGYGWYKVELRSASARKAPIEDWDLNRSVDRLKRNMLIRAIREVGSKSGAAERLGIPRQSLQKMVKRLEITDDELAATNTSEPDGG